MATSTEPRLERFQRRIADVSVGGKLRVGFVALLFVLFLVIGALLLTVSRLGAANDQIDRVAVGRASAAAELRFAAADLRAEQAAYVMDWPIDRSEFDKAVIRFEAALRSLRTAGGDARTHALIDKLDTSYRTFLASDQLVVQALDNGELNLARNLTLGAESLATHLIAEDAQRIASIAEDGRVAAIERFHTTSEDARALGVMLGVVALVVMLSASWAVTKLIRDPLHRVQLAAERAADGDLHAEADVDSNDETGRLAGAFNRMLAELRHREEALRADHHRQEIASRVQRAFEMADDEVAALDVVGLTLDNSLPERSTELLLADNSKSNLEQAVVAGANSEGPGCPVGSPFSCVAVRSGTPVLFSTSEAVDACPHLRNRGVEPCSAVCVPVSFMGRALGVIHSVGEERSSPTPTQMEALTTLAAQAGARIGMLRTMVRTQEQASTDSLTGLMNRRTFQSRTRSLRRSEVPFALVMADIDHFKRVNDTYGHETGDRALKTFSDVARRSLRQEDFMGRWGGEEFALAMPRLTPAQATEVLGQLRLTLAALLSTSDLPGFTVSYGVVDAAACSSLEEAVRLADDALYEAKEKGRDCVVIADDVGVTAPPGRGQRSREATRDGSVGVLASLARDDDPLDG
ncbi:MAG: hypothetical protein RL238_3618 [Actinomycetota bacterium]|jgi:diguanylate cyclase (GGDEF)-like protein